MRYDVPLYIYITQDMLSSNYVINCGVPKFDDNDIVVIGEYGCTSAEVNICNLLMKDVFAQSIIEALAR